MTVYIYICMYVCCMYVCMYVIQATPGNLQQLEDIVFGDEVTFDSNIVLAIKLASESGQRVKNCICL